LIAALAERLKAKLPERQGGNPEKEAQTFMSQARLLTLCGDREASLRANETAYAIWPDRTTRLALVEAYSKRKYMWETFNKVPEQDQVKALQYEVRMLTLLREQWRTELAPGAPEAQDSGPQGASLGTPINAGFGVLIREAPPEISALQKEAVALQRNIFDMAMDAAQRDPKKYGYAYWEALGSAVWRVNSIHFLHPQEQAAGWREFFIALRKRPASDEVGPRWTIQSLREEMNSLRGLSEPDKADVRRLFIPVFKEFTSDPDLTVRLAAHVGLINVDPSAADSAEIFLQYTAEGVDWKISSDYSAPPDLSPAQRAAALLCDQRPELAGAYCEKIMGAWIKQGVLNRDEKCTGLVGTLVRGTEKAKGKAEACALCGRVLAALHECKDRQPNAPRWVDQYIHTFEELRAQMTAAADAPKPAPAPEVAGAPDPDDPWKQYEVRCLGLTLKAPVCGAIVRGDRLYCISCADISFGSAGPYQEDGTRKVTVSAHRFPDGGPALRADTLAVPLGKSIIRSQAVWAGFAGDSLYISTGGSLVSFPANAVPRVLTDADGWTVTGMPIAAMAAFGGKLYLTVGERVSGDWVKPKHAFVVFDPAARAVRVIFSNTALEEAQRRDVMIVTVLADEARKCLWVTLAGGKDSSGLFHYDPATDKLDKLEAANQSDTPADIAAPYAGPPVQTVTLCPMGLLVLTMHQGRKPPIVNMLAVLDPQTRKETWLAGQVFGPYLKRRDGDPLFASSSIALWPAWYDGMTLITAGMNAGSGMENKGGGRLFLHRMEREPACYQALVVTPVFEPTPQGLLVFDTAGEGYLIRKK